MQEYQVLDFKINVSTTEKLILTFIFVITRTKKILIRNMITS